MTNYFSSNLKYLRESKNMSKTELAKKLSVHQSTISRWENEEMGATIDNAVDISEVLNVPLPELLRKDLRLEHPNEEIKEFDFGDVKVTLSKNSKITDKDILEMNQFLMEEKIKGNLDE